MINRLIGPVAAILVLLAAAWLIWPSSRPMPAVAFNLVDGRTLHSADLRGKPLLVNFWSVSCEVCIRDMPKLTRLAETLAERGLTVIGVAMPHDPPAAVIDATQKLAPGYPVALDVHGEVNRAFGGIKVTPSVFLVAPDGNIAYQERGPIDEVRIRATLLTL